MSDNNQLATYEETPVNKDRKILPLSSSKYATRTSVKLMDGKAGGSFYGRIVIDKVKKKSWREIIIVYPDDSTITVPIYRNAFRIMPVNGDGYYMKKGEEPLDVPDILKKYEVGMEIPAYSICDLLNKAPNLPELSLKDSVTIDELFDDLLNFTENISDEDTRKKEQPGPVLNQTDYFLISSDDFKSICLQSGWKPLDAIRIFNKLGLLQTDLGAGYQYTVRIGGKTRKFYKFLKQMPVVEEPVILQEYIPFVDNEAELKKVYEKTQVPKKKKGRKKEPYYIRLLD